MIGMQIEPASSRAIWALALGILGIILCGILVPFAWLLGAKELKEIKMGLSPQSGYGIAVAGTVLGIVGTALLTFSCCVGLIWFASRFAWLLLLPLLFS